jgi:hypothetical protein
MLEWEKKCGQGDHRDALVTKGDPQWGGLDFMYTPKRRGTPCFPNAIYCSRTLRREKSRGWIVNGKPWKFSFKPIICE